MKKNIWLTILICALLSPGKLSAEEFNYFVNNWNVIGLKDYTHGTPITPDNKLQIAGDTFVQINYGQDLLPLDRNHGKTAMHGWMPIFLVHANDGPVRYEITYWATPLPDSRDWKSAFEGPIAGENYLNWIKIKTINTSTSKKAQASIEIKPLTGIKTPKRPMRQDVPKFDGKHTREYSWSWELKPNETVEETARYTFFPIDDPCKYDQENTAEWLRRTEKYWRNKISKAINIQVPCKKANDTLLAAHVCQLIASDQGGLRGGEDFYDVFWIRDGAYQIMELEEAGFLDEAAIAIEPYLKEQRPDGRFESQRNQYDGNGQAIWVLWQYYLITQDNAFLERVYPQMKRAALWTMKARKLTENSDFPGVLPPSIADGENLWKGKYHIVGYDLWNLRGMLCTADAAKVLGKTDEGEEFRREAKDYKSAIDAARKKTGVDYLPPTWEKAGTHWGNTETLWPTEIFDRDAECVSTLIKHLREEYKGGYIEGTIQWWRKGGTKDVGVIHPYLSAYTTMADLILGRHEQVVEDFYWYLLHSTATHAFPEGIYYKKREAWNNTIPHVTGACNYALMLRHMLIHEEGNELHLLKAVPDWWLGDGEEIIIERAQTHFGVMNMRVRGKSKGVEIKLDMPKRNPPEKIVLTLPDSRPLLNPIAGVKIVTRSRQNKRWDMPTVIEAYKNIGHDIADSLTTAK